MPGGSQSAYDQQIAADGASDYWPLDEASGSVVYDHIAFDDADGGSGVTRGATGPIPGGGTASTFSGNSNGSGSAATRTAVPGPNTFTLESWVRTSTNRGGKVIGFGNARTGSSSAFDRQIYLASNGRVYFGVYNGTATTVNSTASVNNGGWHQLVATLGAGSMKLYIDGSLVAQRTDVNSAQALNGYWRLGGDNLNGWTNKPLSNYLAGTIGQVAIFPAALTAAQISTHYTQVTTGAVANRAPMAAFTTSATDLTTSLNATSSSDPDGTIASYAWDFGDGSTGSGATASHSYTAGGTYNVTLTVTDNKGATNAVTHPVTVIPPNVTPTAAFTSSASGVALSVDGSSSTDSDGTIASYAWNFGDGGTGSGATATHTYGASGTYSVMLTVTDNRGGTGVTTQPVTVTAPNVAPTASFTASASGLTASLDGSASSDPDGTIASYGWDFGDATTDTGGTASHSYAAAGTYQVTLTVTDNQGAPGTVSKNVTVVAGATVYAADTFGRTTASSWGSAETGGGWTVTGGSSNFSVAPQSGNIKMAAAGAGPYAFLNGVSLADSDSVVDFTVDKAPTGGGTYVSLAARRIGTSDYRARAKLLATGAVQVSLTKVVNGTETALTTQTVSGLTFAVGSTLRLRLQVSGSSSVALSGKVWAVGSTEPATWQVSATDASGPLTVGGSGLVSYLSGSSTNAPVVASFANFAVTSIA